MALSEFHPKPIQTEYAGNLYRSRLEARWAVFLNELGIKFYYEHQGYQLTEDIYYLPDFWLPELKMFLEIKPEEPTAEEVIKARLLADSEYPVAICQGLPGEYMPLVHAYDMCESGGGVSDWFSFWTQDPRDNWKFKLAADPLREERVFCDCRWDRVPGFIEMTPNGKNNDLPQVYSAIKRARQARFEHGETPQI
jgi:hypothetical protein